MITCPKFDSCSAPVCPVDDEWPHAKHLKDEPTCLWLRELSKPNGEAVLRGALPANAVEAILTAAPSISAKHGDIRRQLKRASKSGSKVASGQRMAGTA